jgi:hypothetical protein
MYRMLHNLKLSTSSCPGISNNSNHKINRKVNRNPMHHPRISQRKSSLLKYWLKQMVRLRLNRIALTGHLMITTRMAHTQILERRPGHCRFSFLFAWPFPY